MTPTTSRFYIHDKRLNSQARHTYTHTHTGQAVKKEGQDEKPKQHNNGQNALLLCISLRGRHPPMTQFAEHISSKRFVGSPPALSGPSRNLPDQSNSGRYQRLVFFLTETFSPPASSGDRRDPGLFVETGQIPSYPARSSVCSPRRIHGAFNFQGIPS